MNVFMFSPEGLTRHLVIESQEAKGSDRYSLSIDSVSAITVMIKIIKHT